MGMHINPLLFEEEHLVRQVEKDEEVWFVGVDVCRVLGIRDHKQALERLDEDERGRYTIPTPGGDQDMIVLSEPGVYRLVFTSRKPVAERFKRWLAHDVIPSLRKTGSYQRPGGEQVLAERPEKQIFPDWSLDEWRIKGQTVDRYNKLYGTGAAQWINQELGFPPPPPETVDRSRQLVMVLMPEDGDQ